MGWSFDKSVKFGPMRLNVSKSGFGLSAGVKGFRISKGPRGTRLTAGTGPFRYVKTLSPARRAGRRVAAIMGRRSSAQPHQRRPFYARPSSATGRAVHAIAFAGVAFVLFVMVVFALAAWLAGPSRPAIPAAYVVRPLAPAPERPHVQTPAPAPAPQPVEMVPVANMLTPLTEAAAPTTSTAVAPPPVVPAVVQSSTTPVPPPVIRTAVQPAAVLTVAQATQQLQDAMNALAAAILAIPEHRTAAAHLADVQGRLDQMRRDGTMDGRMELSAEVVRSRAAVAAIEKRVHDADPTVQRARDALAVALRTQQDAAARQAVADAAAQREREQQAALASAEQPDTAPPAVADGGDGGEYTGPRGGRYHYSANGNKVYDSHNGSRGGGGGSRGGHR